MRRKYLWFIIVFCIIATLAVFFQQMREYSKTQMTLELPYQSIDNVQALILQYPDISVLLQKDENGHWSGTAAGSEIPIRQSAVEEILYLLDSDENIILFENPESDVLQSLTPDKTVTLKVLKDGSAESIEIIFLKISEDPGRQLVLLPSTGSIYSIPSRVSQILWEDEFIEDRIFPSWDFTESIIALSISAPNHDFPWEFSAYENRGIWRTARGVELNAQKVETLLEGMRTLRLMSLEQHPINPAMILLEAETSSGSKKILKIGEPQANGLVPVSDGSGQVQGMISSTQLQSILLTPQELAK